MADLFGLVAEALNIYEIAILSILGLDRIVIL